MHRLPAARQNGAGLEAGGHALEVVQRHQNVRRQAELTYGFSTQFAQGFDFQIAPGAPRLTGVGEPTELGLGRLQ